MAETLKRLRETAAWIVLGVSVGYIVLSLVRGGYLLAHHVTLWAAARMIGGSSLSVVMVLLCLAVALACVLVKPATPNAHRIARWAAVVVSVAAGLEALAVVLGLFSDRGGIFSFVLEVLGGVLEVAVKGAVAWLLWRLLGTAPEPQPAVEPKPTDLVTPPATPASWSADKAVGAVWARAGDAASGAAASTWGTAGGVSHGWDVAPKAPEPQAAQAAPAAPKGPWATAGELAEDPSAASRLQTTQTEEAPQGGVSWAPAPREQ